MCRGISYNLTHMPNQFNHDTQDEAGLEVHQFWPLVEIHCSPDLRFFLCSMYTPICLPDYHKPLPPCRSVCERAKAGCSPLLRQYGFAWPDRMSCDRLPVLGRDAEVLCMDYNRSEATTAPPRPFPAKPTLSGLPGSPASGSDCAAGGPSVCKCREPFVPILKESHPLYNKVRTGQVPNCAVPCYQPSFSPDERTFATFWIGLWSVLCFISTSTTVATFLIDMERFRYPERPIIFLSACYLCVSLGFLVRLVVGHASVACSREHSHIHYETTGPALCTVVFLLGLLLWHGQLHLVGHPVTHLVLGGWHEVGQRGHCGLCAVLPPGRVAHPQCQVHHCAGTELRGRGPGGRHLLRGEPEP